MCICVSLTCKRCSFPSIIHPSNPSFSSTLHGTPVHPPPHPSLGLYFMFTYMNYLLLFLKKFVIPPSCTWFLLFFIPPLSSSHSQNPLLFVLSLTHPSTSIHGHTIQQSFVVLSGFFFPSLSFLILIRSDPNCPKIGRVISL